MILMTSLLLRNLFGIRFSIIFLLSAILCFLDAFIQLMDTGQWALKHSNSTEKLELMDKRDHPHVYNGFPVSNQLNSH